MACNTYYNSAVHNILYFYKTDEFHSAVSIRCGKNGGKPLKIDTLNVA